MPGKPTDPDPRVQASPEVEQAPAQPNAQPAGAPSEVRPQDLARQHSRTRPVARRPVQRLPLLGHLKERELMLREAAAQFREATTTEPLSPAAEWMLDNYHLVQQSLRQFQEDIPPGFYRELPLLDAGVFEGYPRIYAVAQELVVTSSAHLDLDRANRFIRLYQEITPLTMGELWALPAVLRLGILECLAQAVGRITGLRRQSSLPGIALPPTLKDDEIVANCILSLRALSSQDWHLFFESVSRVEHLLRGDPAAVYESMDRDTRDRYRKVVEELARGSQHEEHEVASLAVELAQTEAAAGALQPGIDAARAAHVGYYLLDSGRASLEARLDYSPSPPIRLRRWVQHHPTLVYLGSIGLLTLAMLFAGILYAGMSGATPAQILGAGLLLLIPVLGVAVDVVNWLVTLVIPARVLAKMDFEEGIPPSCKTMVVVPSLLSGPEAVSSLLQELELHYLRNQDPNLFFALLTDFTDAPRPIISKDHALVEQAREGIRNLNWKYHRETPGPFYLFHRDPKWNPKEERWMGWERKRGKLHQLNLLLRGSGEGAFSVQIGDLEVLHEIRYVITLDVDTLMPREAAHRLVATLAHPLNHAEFDPRTGAVTSGYTILQPGIEITSTSVNLSRFTRIFAGDVGLDLYTRAVSNAYQDLFGEGIYVGKGIYDVDAFERSLAGRIPENALLSHDLLEGIHGRVGLVTDIVLFEDYPPHYFVYIRRSRRWIRGDWQLLPWLLPGVPSVTGTPIPNDLSAIDRWKILDNLRRSLLAPALLGLLIAGWLWLPGAPLLWTLVGVLSLGAPLLTGVLTAFLQALKGKPWQSVFNNLRNGIVRWLLAITFLLYETLLTFGGIITTLVRLFVTRKGLLQWTSYADTVRVFAGGVTWQQFLASGLASLALAGLIFWLDPAASWIALPFLAAWLLSPAIAYWISRPIQYDPAPLPADGRRRLRTLARRTWLFFEQFVGPEDHWLPPDHFQESPRGAVVHSTSPTDIAMLLLSTLAAHDLGYIGLLELAARLHSTFEGMQQLEMYQGHFLNWYDTRSFEPLPPRYVSTVDSGNLVAALGALRQGCLDLVGRPAFRWQSLRGLLDTLAILEDLVGELEATGMKAPMSSVRANLSHIRERVRSTRDDPAAWAPLVIRLNEEAWPELNHALMSLADSNISLPGGTLRRLGAASDRLQNHLFGLQREFEQLFPWLLSLGHPPELVTLAPPSSGISQAFQALRHGLPVTPVLNDVDRICNAGRALLASLEAQIEREGAPSPHLEEARDWCTRFGAQLDSSAAAAAGVVSDLQEIGENSDAYIRGTDFGFLFDSHRQLFHIGYNITAGRLDPNYYDLLASEARIASLVAIARDQVPQSHWMHLGRPLTRVDGSRLLLSWGGTMFEYLMPDLLMRTYEGTFLHQSSLNAVDVQIGYGQGKGVPWGISESGYYAFDSNQNYQYRSFGVPGLGLKRDLEEDLVVSSYASLLALPLRPRQVVENMERLAGLGALGAYGLYEAIDFTSSRLAPGETHAIVRSYMAHHQGMILLSILNYLQDDVMVRRFHSDPLIHSADLLLQEKIPFEAPSESPRPGDAHGPGRAPIQREHIAYPWSIPARAPGPQAQLLSNGRYSVVVTSAGAGFSAWQDLALTRWRADTTREDSGTWIYLQDMDSGELWSAALQPLGGAPEGLEVQFHPHMAEFRRSDHGIGLTMEVAVAPDEDLEVRRVSLTNHTDRPRRIALTSYAEVILASQAADARHPAFNRMFIESEYLSETRTLLFRRRLRGPEEQPVFLAHLAALSAGQHPSLAYETDRLRFLGRGQTPRSPAALKGARSSLSRTTGATLDPILSLRQEIELEPRASAQVSFITLAADSREKALALARRYQHPRLIVRLFDQARIAAESGLRQLNLASSDLEIMQQLLSALLYPRPALRAAPEVLAANHKGQSGLWPFGISGDFPILLIRVDNADELPLVERALQAHAYWRARRILIDLVILNQQGTTYGQELSGQLQRLLVHHKSQDWINRRGGIFVLNVDQLGEAERSLLETAARVILDGGRGALADQLQALRDQATRLPPIIPTLPDPHPEPTPFLARPGDLLFDNGFGGFSPDGREYVIYLEPGVWTPAPWINVVANPRFGFTVSETGAGYTWFGNSSENKLTPWSNDAVTDPPGEALYLRDEETAEVWSPAPMPCRAPAPCLVRHAAGSTVFEQHSHGLRQRLRLFAAPDAPVKVVQIRLENLWSRPRRITATFYAEWTLGVTREDAQQYIVTEYESEHQALLARNAYSPEFGGHVAFAAASKPLHGLTADRTEFLGRMGSLSSPAALERIGLAGAVGAGLDPCAALQLHIDLQPGASEEFFFLLGQSEDRPEALRLLEQFRNVGQVEAAWDAQAQFWDGLLGLVQVETPDPAMDLLLNRWLLYQALACRVWARSAFYQSSGAFGFRDQLQDVTALLHAAPDLARRHILDSAQRQFEQGDVLHWWHPPSGRGVRTRFSDDLLWLPFVTALYVSSTGDASILDEEAPFLTAEPLARDEVERYGQYSPTPRSYTLYEHCIRALERGSTAGAHGLPLMGGGDWNDGMNRVGIQGRGESVWLAWFLGAALNDFAAICELKGDRARAESLRQRAAGLAAAANANAWDGAWYRRAYYDDGSPLGSSSNNDCQIDSVAQSWAVISGLGDPDRRLQAMQAVLERLLRPDDQLLLLLAPPFDRTPRDPGYIKGYPPGLRENGGQYTHAALWVILAFTELGDGERAASLFRLLNPIYHADTAEKAGVYRVEPYVIAADVYSTAPHTGRGGWTWYTGSAGWMYRIGVEAILGLRRRGEMLSIDPCIPPGWQHYQVTYRFGKASYHIRVENPDGLSRGVSQLTLDGNVLPEAAIPLTDDAREHHVEVRLGNPSSPSPS